MPKAEHIDVATRQRLARWLDYFMVDKGIPSGNQLAKELGLSQSTIQAILTKERLPGFDVFLAMRKRFRGVHTDALLDDEPPAVKAPESQPRPAEAPKPVRVAGRKAWSR